MWDNCSFDKYLLLWWWYENNWEVILNILIEWWKFNIIFLEIREMIDKVVRIIMDIFLVNVLLEEVMKKWLLWCNLDLFKVW